MAAGDLTTLAAVRSFLGMDPAFTSDDALLGTLISRWSEQFVNDANRIILSQTYQDAFNGTDLTPPWSRSSAWSGIPYALTSRDANSAGNGVTLRNYPVQSILSVSIDGVAIPARDAAFTGSITGTLLTVSAVASGTLAVGQALVSSFIPAGITIVSFGTGTGGTGTYNLSASTNAAGASFTASQSAASGWILDNDRVKLSGYDYVFTRGYGNIIVVYTAGYATSPPDVDGCVAERVAFEYARRQRLGQRSKTIGGETVSFIETPDSWEQCNSNYRRIQVT